ncbi:hypothetical protein ABT104_25885 [Streptomyces mobaraensis]|uniref:hypothetical protein n=1 Tax=Streptomyces mobaraensis TaxID=35621 RepID=UPI003327196F
MKDESSVPLPQLPDPYEPLIILYERGGEFPVEHGYATFLPWRLPLEPREKYLTSEPGISLESAALDALDEEKSI